jgi:hypothetical protein
VKNECLPLSEILVGLENGFDRLFKLSEGTDLSNFVPYSPASVAPLLQRGCLL